MREKIRKLQNARNVARSCFAGLLIGSNHQMIKTLPNSRKWFLRKKMSSNRKYSRDSLPRRKRRKMLLRQSKITQIIQMVTPMKNIIVWRRFCCWNRSNSSPCILKLLVMRMRKCLLSSVFVRKSTWRMAWRRRWSRSLMCLSKFFTKRFMPKMNSLP